MNLISRMLFKKGDYIEAIQQFTLAMDCQDFKLAQTLNIKLQNISKQAFINDDMDAVERITFIKTGKLPIRKTS